MEDEILYVISGSGTLFCDGETFEARPHRLRCGRPAARHNIEILGPLPARPAGAATQFRPRTGRESRWAP